MSKNPHVQARKGKKNREIASIIADLHGVSTRYVRMVMMGDRDDEKVFSSVMEYIQGKNLLIQAIKETIPFNN